MAEQNLSFVDATDTLFKGIGTNSQVWMSHADTIIKVPENYTIVASTHDVKVAGYAVKGEQTWGIQFHPEVYHSTDGALLLTNFVKGICGCHGTWTSDSFIDTTVAELKQKIRKR